jgi:multidrug resistance efflux pump
MDVRRTTPPSRRRWLLIGAAAVVLVIVGVLLVRLGPAAPVVERSSIVTGVVQRGDLIREVQGPGILVSESVQHVAAVAPGRVTAIHFLPGAEVSAEDVLVSLANPDVQLEVLQAEQQWSAARAWLAQIRQALGSQALAQEANVAALQAQFLAARRDATAAIDMAAGGFVSDNERQTAIEQRDAAQAQLESARAQLNLLRVSADEQLRVQREQVARLAAIYDFARQRAASLAIPAGADGVLQDIDLEVGEFVQSGTTLARVAQPGQLKAELRIAQTQVEEDRPGLPAMIDIRTDTIYGTVSRLDPNVQEGTVLVEISLDRPLPAVARPDLTVNGSIQLEHVQDVVFVDRPVTGVRAASASLFRLDPREGTAERVHVEFGRSSVRHAEVLAGLVEGDEVILSDLSRHDGVDRIRVR